LLKKYFNKYSGRHQLVDSYVNWCTKLNCKANWTWSYVEEECDYEPLPLLFLLRKTFPFLSWTLVYLTKVWLKFKFSCDDLLIGSVNCEFKSTQNFRNVPNHNIKIHWLKMCSKLHKIHPYMCYPTLCTHLGFLALVGVNITWLFYDHWF